VPLNMHLRITTQPTSVTIKWPVFSQNASGNPTGSLSKGLSVHTIVLPDPAGYDVALVSPLVSPGL